MYMSTQNANWVSNLLCFIFHAPLFASFFINANIQLDCEKQIVMCSIVIAISDEMRNYIHKVMEGVIFKGVNRFEENYKQN